MNARKALLILGSIALALVAACVALAIFSHKKMETERNQAKTAPARERRWAKRNEDQPQVTQVEKEIEQNTEVKVDLPQSENEIV